MPNISTYFLPYQIEWLNNKSRIKIWEKSRRIGATYVQSYEDVEDCVFQRLKQKKVWFTSADESAAREYIDYCAQWAKIYDMGARELGEIVIDKEKDIKALSIELANGYKINALTSNPKRFRSKGGKVVWDEAAHHDDQEAMWKAAKPSAMWGDPIRILSTHQGRGFFYKLIELVKKGKLDWGLQTTDIVTAAHQGLVSKILMHKADDEEIQEWLDQERKDAIDEVTWLEEYMCLAQDEGESFIGYDIIGKCEELNILWEQDIIPMHWDGSKDNIVEPQDKSMTWVHDKIKLFTYWLNSLKVIGNLYLGLDVGRRKDITVIWVNERLLNIDVTRTVIVLDKMKFWVQEELLWAFLGHKKMVRGCIDETGIGMQLAERAVDKFGESRVEAVNFAAGSVRSDMAYYTKRSFEDHTTLIPKDEIIRADIHSIKKIVTSGNNIRLEADRSEIRGSHADRFWGLSLALHAGREDFTPLAVYSTRRRESNKLLKNFDISDVGLL